MKFTAASTFTANVFRMNTSASFIINIYIYYIYIGIFQYHQDFRSFYLPSSICALLQRIGFFLLQKLTISILRRYTIRTYKGYRLTASYFNRVFLIPYIYFYIHTLTSFKKSLFLFNFLYSFFFRRRVLSTF